MEEILKLFNNDIIELTPYIKKVPVVTGKVYKNKTNGLYFFAV